MGREERQSLLHEGAGAATMSAYVEITFDNSDHRFPTGKDETVIRRTIGLKKDEYSLDKKSSTRTEETERQRELEEYKRESAKAERQYVMQELEGSMAKRVQLEAIMTEKEKGKRTTKLHKELKETIKRQQENEKKIAAAEQKLLESENLERREKEVLELTEKKYQELQRKAGRLAQFNSVEERNTWIEEKLGHLEETRREFKGQAEILGREEVEIREKIKELQMDEKKQISANAARQDTLKRIQEEVQEQINNRNEVTDSRKDLWRREARLETETKELLQKKQEVERRLCGMVNRSLGQGLQELDQMVAELGLGDKVYGRLYELFEVDQDYQQACEAVAGGSLFHVVVEDDQVAAQLIQELQRRKAGRLTFMPLNVLRTKGSSQARYMQQTQDAIAMVDLVKYEQRVEPAMMQVFGRAVICPTLEVAAGYARSDRLIAVTLDGDRTDGSGVFSGGLNDSKRASRIEVATQLKHLGSEYTDANTKLQHVKSQAEQNTAEIAKINARIQELGKQHTETLEAQTAANLELERLRHEVETCKQQLKTSGQTRNELEINVKTLDIEIDGLGQEMAAKFANKLTQQELAEMTRLAGETDEQRAKVYAATSVREDIQSAKQKLQHENSAFLQRKIESIQQELQVASLGSGSMSHNEISLQLFANHAQDLARASASEESNKQRIAVLDRELADLDMIIDTAQREADQANMILDQLNTKQLQPLMAQSNELVGKKLMLAQKLDRCLSDIRALGVLPDEVFEDQYALEKTGGTTKKSSGSALVKRLVQINSQLRGLGHVNKKAVDQYNNFSRQKQDLVSRRAELDASLDSINKLIHSLDARKEQSIEATYNLVAKNFAQVFETLVPNGKGTLAMVRDDTAARGRRAQYTGVSVNVSFTSKTAESLVTIQQLSGGQKSLVSLALIFAIQRADPAPFYLFDEIDANLDAVYRTAVASLMFDQSRSCQFITTTFRSELLAYADNFYGVVFRNKLSSIASIPKQDAIDFVEHQNV
ncbi:Chromosome segregation protein sudA [Zancudomyces culisetae]|uniref:Chromosome segregation protein sudA n=1 Tax=Zancudomyces culisetae TaxID=1213189 RepID=A0A1R1PVB1_ZANCU|nr:Chromosome segregation protein sudA [Zancudomyces culisetae]|eukprot:OMH84915.1 Chromosome segregation protein sudA [Zancudomyces culisetae]